MITMRLKRGQKSSKAAKLAFKLSRAIHQLTRFRLIVTDDTTSYIFTPRNLTEYYRCVTFFTKEEGTLAWIKNSLANGEVFYDIGANIGLYSLYAAKLDRNAKIYAFEPHKYTFANLMENICANNLAGSITPISIPLNDTTDVSTLNYAYLDSGSSMSQLGHNLRLDSGAFQPKMEETLYCATLDELIWKKAIPAPHHIKIDVDGNEIKILQGMTQLLASLQKPRSIQVEINPGQKEEVVKLLGSFGYRADHTHYSGYGKNKMAEGADQESIAYNIVFTST